MGLVGFWMSLKMNIKNLDPKTLIPYANNAKLHNDEQITKIASSIKEFGFNNPVLIDGENGIIAGHGRTQAALKIGLGSVPTISLEHLTEPQKKAYILADNRLGEIGGCWDEELLKIELEGLDDFDLSFDDDGIGEIGEIDLPDLKDGDREPFQQMTFTLHDEQAEQVKQAIEKSKSLGSFDSLNENSNGNAIARICETFLSVG